MTKREKLLNRIRNNPRNVSIHDLQLLLETFGFELDRIRGSHYIFVGLIGGDEVTLAVPAKHPIKAVYVTRVLELIDEVLLSEGNIDEH